MAEPLWRPSPERAALTEIAQWAARHGFEGPDAIERVWDWSVEKTAEFWREVCDRFGVVASRGPDAVLENDHAMPGAKWFTGAKLNYA